MVDVVTAGRQRRAMAHAIDPRYTEPVIKVEELDLREYRCAICKRLLFKAEIRPGSTVEIMCHNSFCRQHRRKIVFSVA